ncbi:MAG: hypothetical protein QG670_2089 [Thermoproteota archaeon]|nr:hypothetical protein [Thermoproteota archaeon]
MIKVRTEKEIRERLERLKKERLTEGSYLEKTYCMACNEADPRVGS